MPRVTALRGLPRGRVAVDVDGSRWRVLPGELVLGLGLAVDQELDRPRLREIARELRRHAALRRATGALRRRELSAQAVRERLDRGGTPPAAREDALATLERAGLVDDARLARVRAESLAGRGMGDAAIRFDLARRGIAEPLVDDALAGLEPERERAGRLVDVHGAGPRTARLLARRGFGEDSIEAVSSPDVADYG